MTYRNTWLTRCMSRAKLPIITSLSSGYRHTFRRFGRTLLLVAAVQGAVVLVAAPVLVGMFSLAARASGLVAVTDTTAGALFGNPLGVTIVALSLLLTVLAALTQLAIFAIVAQRRGVERDALPREVIDQLWSRARRLLVKPSTLVLIPYLVLLVPLGHVGFGSVLTQWVSIPSFASDELLKSPLNTAIYLGFLLLIWWVNLRLLFTVPLLALGEHSVPAAIAASWRLTRWRSIRVVALLLGVAIPLSLALSTIGFVVVMPTVLSDVLAPDASVVMAAIGLGVFQVVAFFVVGVFLMVQMQTLVEAARSAGAIDAIVDEDVASQAAATPVSRSTRRAAAIVTVGALVMAGGLSAGAMGPMSEIADGATDVLGHRGFSDDGIENTLGGLEAANRAGADLVEMDVLQTSDGKWVVMHDTNLSRLAGVDVAVSSLTLAEATEITVHDNAGREEKIPSLEEYLKRADELGQQLLIEIKIHGKESPNYVAELIEFIDEVDNANTHIYHSLIGHVVEQFTTLRPDLTIGYIVALSYAGVPESPADFLVLEQSVYSREKRDIIWDRGQGVFVWTVQDASAMRQYMRDNVDGIITDHPDVALVEQSAVSDDTGVASRLSDAVDRLIASP